MSDAFDERASERLPEWCQMVVKQLAEAVLVDLRARYALAQHIHAVRYGPLNENSAHSLSVLANRLLVHPSVLRRHARVAEAISANEFLYISQLRTQRGLPLTWSHLECLALVRTATARKQLAVAAAGNDLSVRALAALVRKRAAQAGER